MVCDPATQKHKIWAIEKMVIDIKRFGAELQLDALTEVNIFEQRQIPLTESVPQAPLAGRFVASESPSGALRHGLGATPGPDVPELTCRKTRPAASSSGP